MKLIFVCSPLVGNLPADASEHTIRQAMTDNQARAEMFCWYVSNLGHHPYAPHLLCTRFLDDTKPHEREKGIQIGLDMLRRCEEMWVFLGAGEEPSRGMMRELELAHMLNIPVRYVSPATVELTFARDRGML